MRTFDNGTVGFSRRRGVALNASNSLMGADGFIGRDRFKRGRLREVMTTIPREKVFDTRKSLLSSQLHKQI